MSGRPIDPAELDAIMTSEAMRRILSVTPGLEAFQHLAHDPHALFAELGRHVLFSAHVRIVAHGSPLTRVLTAVREAEAEVRRST